jgi:ABC-2 type transport system permease protein
VSEPVAAMSSGEPRVARLRGGSVRVWQQELGTIGALWRRDLLRLRKERTRWLGVVLQPLLFWLILGTGMARTFVLPGAEGATYQAFLFPGVLVMILLFTSIFATISVIEDRRMGFLQQVLVAPGSRLALVLGKVAGVCTIAALQAALFLAVCPFAGLDVSAVRWGAVVAVVLLSTVGLTAANLVVAWLVPSVQGYHALMSIVMLPLWVLSGALFPVSEGWLEAVAVVNPLTYMVAASRAALGGPAGAEAIGLAPSLWALLALAVGTLAAATWVCRRR